MSDKTVIGEVTLRNRRGLHARAAGKLVTVASTFQADVSVSYNNKEASADSIMDLMMLGAGYDAKIKLICRGKEAALAFQALSDLIEKKFNEDD